MSGPKEVGFLEGYDQDAISHDFLNDRNVLMTLSCYRIVKHPKRSHILNLLYVGMVFLIVFYLTAMGLIAICKVWGDTVQTIHTFHLLLLLTVTMSGMAFRIVNNRLLQVATRTIREGIYTYDGETMDKTHLEIRKAGVAEIRKVSKAFSNFLSFSATSNTVFVSLVQMLVIKEDASDRPLNPYLPQPIYIPFDTRSVIGFAGGFLFSVIYMFYLCIIVIAMDEVNLSCYVQLRDQFRILNHSLLDIERRALNLYRKETDAPIKFSISLFQNKDFQDCLYQCLRRNIQHHQALLRLKKTCNNYMGGSFLTVVSLASLILAAHVILILEKPDIHIMVNFIVTLTAELLYTFHYCWYGENLINESSKLYNALYGTPWVQYNQKCKKLLLIFMMSAKNPMAIKTTGFNIPAALATFGSIISTMYQIMNVVRTSK